MIEILKILFVSILFTSFFFLPYSELIKSKSNNNLVKDFDYKTINILVILNLILFFSVLKIEIEKILYIYLLLFIFSLIFNFKSFFKKTEIAIIYLVIGISVFILSIDLAYNLTFFWDTQKLWFPITLNFFYDGSIADLKETSAQLKLTSLRYVQAESAYKKEQDLLTITQSRYKRSQDLLKRNVLSQNDFDAATENLTRQELAVSKAELVMQENQSKNTELEAKISRLSAKRDKSALELERATIVAPFNGVVSELTISLGDRVRYGDPILRIQNPDAMEIRAQIPSRYAKSLRKSIDQGLEVPASVSLGTSQGGIQDADFIEGRMIRVSGLTRESSGGVDSFIGFPQSPLGLSLGSTVKIQVQLPPLNNVIAVPAEAIYGNNKIYRVVEGRMQMLVVNRLGESRLPDGRTQVLIRSEQLSEGDQIITTKLSNASNGLLVKIIVPSDQAIAKEPDLPNAQQGVSESNTALPIKG